MNLPSVHDDHLVGYGVDGLARELTLRIRSANSNEVREIVFTDVQGYVLENDALENVLFELEAISPEQLLQREGSRIGEMYRLAGAPGTWAADLSAAADRFQREGLSGFVLSASFGISGWILAKSIRVAAQPGVAADAPQAARR